MCQEGVIGLQRAIGKFSEKRGCRLSTYAAWWIRESITRSLSNKSRTVRVPVHLVELISKIRRARENELKLRGCEPTATDLAAIVGVSVEAVNRALNLTRATVYLETHNLESDEQGSYGPLQLGYIDDRAERALGNECLKRELGALLEILPREQRLIVELRFGLFGKEPHTLSEIASKLNLSRNRLGKESSKAMRKLRSEVGRRKESLLSYLQ